MKSCLLFLMCFLFIGSLRCEIVKTGIEVLKERNFDILCGKKVAVITNQTGIDSNYRLTVDILKEAKDVELVAIFAPEHGFLGGVQGDISDSYDHKKKVPVYSLYGSTRVIPDEKLKNVDVIVYDIQDIGTRSYTYISTMKLAMEQAAKNNKEFVVLDRPNPINGVIVDGPVLEPQFKSFIGIAEIPFVHGMTAGELALFFNKELNINCKLTVIPMKGWKRTMTWQDTGLPWVPTSPHIPEPDTPWYYPVTGIIGELPLVNIGVGYTLPFKLVGAPWIDAETFAQELNRKKIEGVYFQPFYYKPYYGGFKDKFCNGVRIIITDKNHFSPFLTSVAIMETLIKLYPFEFDLTKKDIKDRIAMFDKACGSDIIRKKLMNGETYQDIANWYQAALKDFIQKRAKYLLY